MKCFFLIFSILAVTILIPNTFAQEPTNIPAWIKNNAGWWASDQITDSAFLQGIQYLIKERIMVIPSTEMSESPGSQNVPDWIKNTAGWWAKDKISEVEFVNAIQYLIEHGVITMDNGSACTEDLLEIFGDSNEIVQIVCDSHESSEYTELVPFIERSNLNNLGFRGPEFSEIKSPNTYRIFMVGGSTMFGSGGYSDETTIPGILQQIFDLDNSVQKIEVINAGFSGGNSGTEFNLIGQALVALSPDLVIVYDGWNDLKADSPVQLIKENWGATCELAKINDFDVIISLQPIVGFGNKKLTQQEVVNSFTGEDNYGYQLITAKSTYDYMGRELLSLQYDGCDTIDLRGVFDDVNGPIYWDQGHISDTGNLILAEKFYNVINEIIFDKKSNEDKFHEVISKYNSPAITSYLLSKIDIYVDYTQLKQDLSIDYKLDGNFFYLKNQLGGNEKILVGKDLSKDDLSKINLIGQDLSGANLSGQDLRYVDLTDTLLRSANLSFTNLSGQDLSGKDLTGVNFHGANLENTNLSDITTAREVRVWLAPGEQCPSLGQSFTQELNTLYSGHKCAEKIIQNEKIRTDFSDTNLKGVTMSFSEYHNMHHIDFSGADLTGIELSQIVFRNCNFTGAKLNDSRMNEAMFFYVDFINAEMKNSQFTGIPFFQNVSFHNAKIINGYFEKPVFIDTDFSNANLMNTIIYEPTMAGDIHNKCKNNQICE